MIEIAEDNRIDQDERPCVAGAILFDIFTPLFEVVTTRLPAPPHRRDDRPHQACGTSPNRLRENIDFIDSYLDIKLSFAPVVSPL
ncbi:MAG TPA: hypothetical protein VHN14_00160 [Kofleriaceae bacterium]|jgi:hypothetical protein|nr:hypothetical protein [Kofleriaceae bacterium]